MKVVIVEDEHLAAKKLQKMLQKYDPSLEIIKILDSVESAVEWLNDNDTPDLILMDIQLTDGTSFDILKSHEISCPVIFTTAYDQYALEAFRLHSIAYLIKPVSQEKLNEAMQKLKKIQTGFTITGPTIEKLLMEATQWRKEYKSRFLVRSGSILKSISIGELAYFYSEDKLVFMKTKTNQRYTLSETLDELEQVLDPTNFFRINRQFIVHIDTIQKVHPHFNGRLKIELVPDPNEDVYISNRRVASFKAWMNM